MAQLAGINYNPGLSISARYAPTLNAAFYELAVASGIIPQVTRPDGDARTAAEQIALGSVAAWWRSDHYEGNWETSAAIDLYNQRSFRNWDEARFLSIMAKHGWHNMDIAGNPFPSEPWHFANHGTLAPAGETGDVIEPTLTPIHPKDRKKLMYGFIKRGKGSSIAIVYGDGPYAGHKRGLKNAEWGAFEAQGWKVKEVAEALYDAIPDVKVGA